jgi:hypothetical protein
LSRGWHTAIGLTKLNAPKPRVATGVSRKDANEVMAALLVPRTLLARGPPRVDTYHHIGNRTQYFAKLKSSLRPARRLGVIDFRADSPNGPPVRHRISPERVTQELNAAGYALVDTLEFLPRQYCLIF